MTTSILHLTGIKVDMHGNVISTRIPGRIAEKECAQSYLFPMTRFFFLKLESTLENNRNDKQCKKVLDLIPEFKTLWEKNAISWITKISGSILQNNDIIEQVQEKKKVDSFREALAEKDSQKTSSQCSIDMFSPSDLDLELTLYDSLGLQDFENCMCLLNSLVNRN